MDTPAKKRPPPPDPKKVRISADSYHRLQLEVGFEERYGPVRALRCLPLTQPGKFISLEDDEGNEIGIISDLADLDRDSRKAVEDDLELFYLKARVEAIRKVEARNGVITWELVTNLGPRTVHVRDRQNIRSLKMADHPTTSTRPNTRFRASMSWTRSSPLAGDRV